VEVNDVLLFDRTTTDRNIFINLSINNGLFLHTRKTKRRKFMSFLTDFMKKPVVQASLIGAFGGIAPKLIEITQQLYNNQFPTRGNYWALVLLAIMGAVVVIIYKEDNLQKALMLGAGAPAIIATLIAHGAVSGSPTTLIPIIHNPFYSVAYAQDIPQKNTLKFIIKNNKSPYKLNALWLRADSKTIEEYQQHGDTVTVAVPGDTKELRVDLPEQSAGLELPNSSITKNKTIHLEITTDQDAHDFWKTFGNVNTPKYKIDTVEEKKP
jgi:hypothetical protein